MPRNRSKKPNTSRMGLLQYFPPAFLLNLGIILVFGLLMLFSASYATGYLRHDDSYHFIRSQMGYALLGVAAMLIAAQFDYHLLDKFHIPWGAYFISLLLLGLVLTCEPINNCRRWLHWSTGPLKFFPSIQVSEIVKFVMVLVTARLMIQYRSRRNTLLHGLIIPMLPLIPVLILLYFEPHLSGMILMCMIVGTMLLLGGNAIGWIGGAAGCAVALALFGQELIAKLTSYAGDRLEGWTDVFDDMLWQTQQSLLAIGSGGMFGLGLGNSMEKQLWLPESTNDFIFSIVCEELGFVGAMTVVVLFAALILQCVYIAYNAPDLYGTLVALGITGQVMWQVVFNLAVVTNSVPNTGISLPFFSSGGTSLLMLLGEMGVLLNIARQGNKARAQRQQREAEKENPPANTIRLQ